MAEPRLFFEPPTPSREPPGVPPPAGPPPASPPLAPDAPFHLHVASESQNTDQSNDWCEININTCTHHSSKSAKRISPVRCGSSLGSAAFSAGPDSASPRSSASAEASKYLLQRDERLRGHARRERPRQSTEEAASEASVRTRASGCLSAPRCSQTHCAASSPGRRNTYSSIPCGD
jgi:hypothetical protein